MKKKNNHFPVALKLIVFLCLLITFVFTISLAAYMMKISYGVSKTSDKNVNWITYQDPINGYSFKYPSTWKTYAGPNDWTTFSGKEGIIYISSNNSDIVTIDCPETSEEVKVLFGTESIKACHRYNLDETNESWEQINRKLPNGENLRIEMALVNYPIEKNRKIILEFLSSFKFTN